MRLSSNAYANKSAVLLRIRCVELSRRGKAIKVGYMKHEFWLPLSWCRKIEDGEDGYTRITLPDWMLAKKVAEARFEEQRGTMTRRASLWKAGKRRQDVKLS